MNRGYPKIPREQRDEPNLGRIKARGGRIPTAVFDRRATKSSAQILRHPLGPGSFGPGAASLACHVALRLCSSLDSLLQAQNPSGAATRNFRIASRDLFDWNRFMAKLDDQWISRSMSLLLYSVGRRVMKALPRSLSGIFIPLFPRLCASICHGGTMKKILSRRF